MRRILLTCFGISLGIAFSQQIAPVQVVPAQEYQNMKNEGRLQPDIHYRIDPATMPDPINVPYIPPPTGNTQSVGCACYIPPDNSYSIVPFTIGTPPNYTNDDGSTNSIPIPFNFCLYGSTYNAIYINNNGNITFDAPYSTFSASAFPTNQFVMVAPFWADVDTRGTGLVYYKITPTAVYVNWVAVGYYNTQTDKVNTFSVIITDGNDPIIGVGNNVAFCYQDMQWTTGSASNGVNGFGGVPATVGCNKGDAVNFVQFGRFDSPGTAYAGPYVNNGNGVSWLDNQSFVFNACNSTNIAPAMSGGAPCDTLEMCVGDTLIDTLTFLSPEAGQITTITASSASPDFSIINISNGNTATIIYQVIGNSPSIINFNINAVDDGTPPQNVTYTMTVRVNPNNTPEPTIIGDTIICPGDNSILTVIGGVYDTYNWNTGSVNDSIFVNSGGIYDVTVSLNGCKKRDSITVFAFASPVPTITGDLTVCHLDSTTLTVSNGPFGSYTWSSGSTSASTTVPVGTYTVTVTDGNGCAGSATVTVIEDNPVLNITATPSLSFCPGDSIMLTAAPVVGFNSILWSTGETTPSIYVDASGPVSIIGVASNNCIAGDTVNVIEYPDLDGNIVLPIACENQTAAFSFNSTGAAISDYTWNFSTGNPADTSDLAAPTFVYPGDGPGNITLVLTSTNNCVRTFDTTFTVHPQPAGTLVLDPICLDQTMAFNPSITSPDSIATYNWTIAGGNPSTSNIRNPTIDFTTTGSHPVSLAITTIYGCTTIVNADAFVRLNPIAGFVTPPLCISRFTFIPQVSPNDNTVSIDWNLGDGTIMNNTDTSIFNHIYQGPGNYVVTQVITDQYGCTDSMTQTIVVDDTLWVKAPNILVQSSTVGNNAVDLEALNPGMSLCIDYTYTIFDRWGVKLFQQHNDPYNPDVSCGGCFKGKATNGAVLTPGVYFYVLEGNYAIIKSGSITIFD